MDNALAVVPQDQNLAPAPLTPKEQVERASEMARVLQDVVNQANLAKSFGGQKKHLEFEAWQTIGQFFNSTPITEWTKPIHDGDKIIGWESRVIVHDGTGREIGAAESMCMRDEKNWANKPNYALRSMAQTRAAGKALRSVFAFVAVLAGYSATPSEEMVDAVKSTRPAPKHQQKQAPRSSNPDTGDGATPNQYKKLYAMGFEMWPDDPENDVRLRVRTIGAWYRKGESLTKKEASELIENWVDAVDGFMESQGQMPDDYGNGHPDAAPPPLDDIPY